MSNGSCLRKNETFSRGGPDGITGFSFPSISMLCQAFQEIMPLYIYLASPLSLSLSLSLSLLQMSRRYVTSIAMICRRKTLSERLYRCMLRERVSYVA